MTHAKPLSQLTFEDSFTRALPGDPDQSVRSRQVTQISYSFVMPTPVSRPQLLGWSDDLAREVGVQKPSDTESLAILAGNGLAPGMKPYAARYGGHQFGHWAGQLGDGRAILLGETNSENRHWEWQLKGAGPTPYSRRADGRAVLRSSLREFVCSEAMHYLGIPTTRALSLVATGDDVVRDMFYDGNPEAEPGAIVCRLAPSFLRFGNFEILRAQNEPELSRRLATYAIETFFPELGPVTPETFSAWYVEICRRTAKLVVEWQRVGFVHGVMNTDNMSILGLTIDYGPYGWLEGYDPMWTPNTTDSQGRRYSYGQQPNIAYWNAHKLGLALQPLFALSGSEDAPLEAGLAAFRETFEWQYSQMLAGKFGIEGLMEDADVSLVNDWHALLGVVETDYTLAHLGLADVSQAPLTLEPFLDAFYKLEDVTGEVRAQWMTWLLRYQERLARSSLTPEARSERMRVSNPRYIFRNYLAQEAIEKAANGDTSALETLLDVLKKPYDRQPKNETYAERRPEWARHKAGCSALSCSS